MANQFIAHVEIPSTNLEASKEFYKKVFDWDLKDFGNGYLLYNSHKGITIGLRKVKKVNTGDSTIFHVSVTDIEDALDKVKTAGGKVFREKTVIPVFGWFALLIDNEGNIIGLYQSH
ncbi:MAG: VOC family protein [Ignavibacteria bacterium]|nr:VOC family protein [Ignavibacteria bacterium]